MKIILVSAQKPGDPYFVMQWMNLKMLLTKWMQVWKSYFLWGQALAWHLPGTRTVIWIIRNCPKNQILSEKISWASIYPSQVIEVYFYVKNKYFFYFHQISKFWTVLPYELCKKNLTFSNPILPIPARWLFLITVFGAPMSTGANSDFFSEIVH